MKRLCVAMIIMLGCILLAGCAVPGPVAGLPPAPTSKAPTILDYAAIAAADSALYEPLATASESLPPDFDSIVAADSALYEPLTTSTEALLFLLDYDAIVAADSALYEPPSPFFGPK